MDVGPSTNVGPRSSAASAPSASAGNSGAGSGVAVGGRASEAEASTFKRPCISNGKEVVFIGDSYSNYFIAHESLALLMQRRAIKDGALKQNETYRDLAVPGATLGDKQNGIPNQWESAIAMKPIKAVVMNGGGYDVWIEHKECNPEGSEKRPECMQVIHNSLDTAKQLWDSMKESGVSDVLYFWYPHIPGGTLTGYDTADTINDYTYRMLEDVAKAASTSTFQVQMIPTVDLFEGHPEWFFNDGLHATNMGEAQIADLIWKVAKSNCILQASGCCK